MFRGARIIASVFLCLILIGGLSYTKADNDLEQLTTRGVEVALSTITQTIDNEWPSFSPNTNELVYVSRNNAAEGRFGRDVWLYNFDSKQATRITSGIGDEQFPQVNSDYIVWSEVLYEGHKKITKDKDISMLVRATGQKKTISSRDYDEVNPILFDHYVVWQQVWGGAIPPIIAIWVYDIIADKTYEVKPLGSCMVGGISVGGDYIVWSDNRTGDYNIYLFNLLTGEKKTIDASKGDQKWPSISGDIIVWEDGRNVSKSRPYNNDIYGYRISTGQNFVIDDNLDECAVRPIVAGELMAYKTAEISTISPSESITYKLRLYDLTKKTNTLITSTLTSLFSLPALSQNWLVWPDETLGNKKILAYSIQDENITEIEAFSNIQLKASGNTIAWQTINSDRTGGISIAILTRK